jgi:hypothetical protein
MIGMDIMNADIIVVDLHQRVLLAGIVKAWELEQEYVEEYFKVLRFGMAQARFFMFADPNRIRIWRNAGEVLSLPDCVLDTAVMLTPYEPEYGRIPIFHDSMVALIETWLWDHMYHWKLEVPPGTEDLNRIGLLPALGDYSSFVPSRELREIPVGINFDGGGS